MKPLPLPKTVLSQVFRAEAKTHFQNPKVPPGWGVVRWRGLQCNRSAWAESTSLPCPESYVPTPGGDACVLGVVEKAGNTLYGARVYVKLGRRLAHAHAARQSCSDSLSQLVRDRRPAKSFTFTLGPSRPARTRRPSAWR